MKSLSPPRIAMSTRTVNMMGMLQQQRQHPSTLNIHNFPRKASQKFKYFTEFTVKKGIFYAVVLVYVFAVSVIILLESVMSDEAICDKSRITDEMKAAVDFEYHNPSYVYRPCDHLRLPKLIFMTREECNFGRRLLAAVLLGGIVGWERREADRPAGIRTMSLVSLGACLFSINSAYAFLDGPMAWDSSRISAAIPSGVGFLGAGLIFKEAEKDKKTGDTTHVVHGLTTAASLWIVSTCIPLPLMPIYCSSFVNFSPKFVNEMKCSLLPLESRVRDSYISLQPLQ